MAGAAKGISAMSKKINSIAKDRDLTPKQKRAQIDEVLLDKRDLARKAVKDMKEIKKEQNDR
jgi:hypothetical protein